MGQIVEICGSTTISDKVFISFYQDSQINIGSDEDHKDIFLYQNSLTTDPIHKIDRTIEEDFKGKSFGCKF